MEPKKHVPSIDEMTHIDAELLTKEYDRVYAICKEKGVICIDEEYKPSMVMMSIEFYEEMTGEKVDLGSHQ